MKQVISRARIMHLLIAATAALAYVMLGDHVSAAPPQRFDQAFAAWTGQAVAIAWRCTQLAFLPALVAAAIVALVGGIMKRAWLPRSIFALACDACAWVTSDVCKLYFHRPRPPHWWYHHETSFSYSSGHAMHAVVVYGLWAYFFWRSDLDRPRRITIAVTLIALVAAISWSRLALGAHYATDILGGWLLGIVILSAGFTLFPRVTQAPSAPSH